MLQKNQYNNPISYQNVRPEILRQIKPCISILDVGCNNGALGEQILFDGLAKNVIGVDYNPMAIEVARGKLTEAFVVDLNTPEQFDILLKDKFFDVIICADVLEHINDPVTIVQILSSHLSPGGYIVISLPHIGHYSLFFHFMRNRLPRRDRGIYDKTHKQFFFKRNLKELCPKDMEFSIVDRNYRLFDQKQGKWDLTWVRFVRFIPWIRTFVTYQFIFTLRGICYRVR